MKIFNNKRWAEVTREERYFCAELYQCLKKNITPFLSLINKKGSEYDIGYEVCFYRDVLKEHGKSIRKEKLPYKRTFDLMLISEKEIIIIEAKANQGFDNKQLEDFKSDIRNIKQLYSILKLDVPDITLIALYSSKYSPSDKTKNIFKKCITWKEIGEAYKTAQKIFQRADSIYET